MIRVVAPSRLHFGLLHIPNQGTQRPMFDDTLQHPLRSFGGVGLMVEDPGLALRVEPADAWSASGAHGPRVVAFAQQFMHTLPSDQQRTFHITVEHAPPEHTGLGVGTQLALATAKALAYACGLDTWNARELAQRVGRGERSAIGIHGFEAGGLIVEAGKHVHESISPLVVQQAFPEEWSILLFTPERATDWHGHRERQAFAKLQQLGPSMTETDTLCRLVLMGMLPALANRDLEQFGAAVYEFNARVGDHFSAAQGGRYGSPAIAATIARIRSLGVEGVGQSSWGPTVFAIVHADEVARLGAYFSDVPHHATRASVHGASVWTGSLS